jgi:cytidine deaminase
MPMSTPMPEVPEGPEAAPGRALTADDRELIEVARRIVDEHGDGLVHTMGAAVRDESGRTYGAINLFHFTGGPCAELVVLGHARARGGRGFTTIVAVGDGGRGPVGPCGRCRQVLFDYHPEIRVLVPTHDGVRNVRIADLMPLAGRWDPAKGSRTFGTDTTT